MELSIKVRLHCHRSVGFARLSQKPEHEYPRCLGFITFTVYKPSSHHCSHMHVNHTTQLYITHFEQQFINSIHECFKLQICLIFLYSIHTCQVSRISSGDSYFRCQNLGWKCLLLIFQCSPVAHQLELAELSTNITEL